MYILQNGANVKSRDKSVIAICFFKYFGFINNIFHHLLKFMLWPTFWVNA